MKSFSVREASDVGNVRRHVRTLAEAAGFECADRERLSLIVTEAGTNLARHAVDGELLVEISDGPDGPGATIVAADAGPGIPNVEAAMVDGFSTGGPANGEDGGGIGGGLGALQRLADAFEIHSAPGGTTVVASLGSHARRPDGPYDIAGLTVPMRGADEGGDIFRVRVEGHTTLVMLLDILGHGIVAAQDARVGAEAFDAAHGCDLEESFAVVAEAMTGGRGAAGLLVALPETPGKAQAVGLGNVQGEILSGRSASRGIPSAPGIVGRSSRTPTPSEHEWPPGAVLVLSTDGLRSAARMPASPSLTFRSAALIAPTLYKLRRRGTDDAGVVVVKAAS